MSFHAHTRSGNNGAVEEATGYGEGASWESARAMALSEIYRKTHGRFSRPGTIAKPLRIVYVERLDAEPDKRWEALAVAVCLLPTDAEAPHRFPNRGHPPGKR